MTKLMIVTPAYDGKVNVQYAVSLAETLRLVNGFGIECVIRINTTGSLLSAERNRLTEFFMNSDCTHMLCVDSDIGWNSRAVINLLEKQEEFVAACYPSRKEKAFIFRPIFNEDGSVKTYEEKRLLEMEYIPAGFMLISRSVIDKMKEKHPHLYFEPKAKENKHEKGWMFFDTEVWEGEFWGEDYVFCRRAREAGVKIYADPLIELDHAGNKAALIQALTNSPDGKEVKNEQE